MPASRTESSARATKIHAGAIAAGGAFEFQSTAAGFGSRTLRRAEQLMAPLGL
jgi:hypothetical protein